jgi:4-aminobutyrate aminotransferase-like enzyme
MTKAQTLLGSQRFRAAKAELLQAISEASSRVQSIQPSSPEMRDQYSKSIQDFNKNRGRDLYFPFVAAGLGSGPYIELLDGSVKLDMVTGIGINFFGHSHPALMAEMVDAIPADIMQGNLEPGFEAKDLLQALLARVGTGCRIKHGWLTCSGTMANEIALKIIRQKKSPATKILAFRDCFAGRSTAMQEITDNPKYREGQPLYGEVEYLPYYDPKDPESTAYTLAVMREHLTRYPAKFAAVMIELVQGEGGFNFAPHEWYVEVFKEAKKNGLAIWIDEVQTWGRTGELFAYQTFGLNEQVDVVTVGKMLQACGVLFTEEYNPKPGLVAGTFSGSTVALRTAKKTIELLEDGFLGKDGKIAKLAKRFETKLKTLAAGSLKGKLGEIRVVGGMVAFAPLGGTMDDVKAVLVKMFEMGVVAFYCGHGPYLVRMLPPMGAMTEADVDLVCQIAEKAIVGVGEVKK